MPETLHDPIRNIPFPTGNDFVTEGPAEMEAIAGAVGALNEGQGDFLRPGVVAPSDWTFTATMENSATCVLGSTGATGGAAWFTNATVGLLRSSTGLSTLKGLKPPSLPASGKFMAVGVELAPNKWGEVAMASVVSGAEQTTQAAAEANSPAVTAGHLRVRDCFIKNTAGTYELLGQRDRRPWAGGLDYAAHVGSVELNTNGESAVLWQARFETSRPGVNVILNSDFFATGSGSWLWGGYYLKVDGTLHGAWELQVPIGTGQVNYMLGGLRQVGSAEVGNGSHLWQLEAHNFTSGTGTTTHMQFGSVDLSLREVLYAGNVGNEQKNGTS